MSADSHKPYTSTDLAVDSELSCGWDICTVTAEEVWFIRKNDDSGYNYLTNDGETVSLEPNEELPRYTKFGSLDDAREFAQRAEGVWSQDSEDTVDEDSESDESFLSGILSDSEEDDSSAEEDNDQATDTEGILDDADTSNPSARNISVSFVQFDADEGFSWSEEMTQFWDKLAKSSTGDASAKRDISGDFWRRYVALIQNNKFAKGDFYDLLFTGGLTLVGLGFVLLTGILSLVFSSQSRLSVIMQPSRYGDLFIVLSVILAFASAFFWLSRRSSSGTAGLSQRLARSITGIFFIGQIGIAVFLGGALLVGSGKSTVYQLEVAWWQLTTQIAPQYLPPSVLSYWSSAADFYLASSPIGLSIFTAALIMSSIGAITAVPVAKRTLARFVLTANMGPREFREKTGILATELKNDRDREKKRDYGVDEQDKQEEENTVQIGESSGRYTLGSSGDSTRTITRDEQGGQDEQSEEVEDLLALPDEMQSAPFAGYDEVRRYWVRAPYAYVSIVYNEDQNDYRYVVVEPNLSEGEEIIYNELKERLDTVLQFEDIEDMEDNEREMEKKRKRLAERMIELSEGYDIGIENETFHRLLYFIERDYIDYNKIDPLMNDPNVEDISCDGEGEYIFVFHRDYKDVITNIKFERETLRSFIQELAQRSGEHISAADPMVDASLPDGSRAQMTLGSEVTTKGSTFTIRLFKEIPFTPVDLLNYDTFSLSQMSYLWTAIEHNKSLIFAGGTASGKTTSMNAVSMFIPPKAKVITIEDTREISLPQQNWIPGTTRDSLGEDGDDIDMYSLLRAALRQRPEYLVVGEIRGEEAETLFQAMNTGHTTYSTMHAETVDAAIGRLTNQPINVPRQMITSLDIICIQNQIRMTDENGNVSNVRRNEEMREIVSLQDSGSFRSREPYNWNPETDEFIESIDNSYVLSQIQEENGWTREELNNQLKERQEVLKYMLDEDITDFEDVSQIIQGYMIDSESIVERIRNGTLDPSNLDDVTDIDLKNPDKTLSEEVGADNAEPTAQLETGASESRGDGL